MKFRHYSIIVFIFLSTFGNITDAFGQIYHEVSLMAGPVSFRGDYGLRGDAESITKNIGFGFGINHYLNFAFTDFGSRYTRQHFKIRSSLIYHSTSLNHYGELSEQNDISGLKLRSMFGEANVLEIGSGLEYYLMRIRDFERNPGAFTPYAGIGFNFVFYSPVADTTLEGGLGFPDTTFPTFLADPGKEPAFTNDSDMTFSANFQGGVKYKITNNSDLFAEIRWHYYFSDFVDGLKPIGDQNIYNDWMFWFTVGYLYNLD